MNTSKIQNTRANEPINLFWTGGWDSTFRLLQLLTIYKKVVQPYYIIDSGRNSYQKEIQTIEKLRANICRKYPYAKELLLPIKFSLLSCLKPDGAISEAYSRVIKSDKLGVQYEWLSRFCSEMGIRNMEMCNETSIFPEDNIVKRAFGSLKKIEDDADYHYIAHNQKVSSDTFILFQYFRLVLYDYTKLEMQEISNRCGFHDIMEQTWFCFFPMLYGIPCGKCHPCKTVYREGLKWRLPFISKVRHFIWTKLIKILQRLRIYKRKKS